MSYAKATRRAVVLPLLATLLLGGLPQRLHGEGFAGQAGAFLRMGSGAAALATGDAGVARAMGAEQAHYNPAGLPYAPANAVNLGYHVLSLDRRLAHLAALYQIPELSSWTAPIEALVIEKIEPRRDLDGQLVSPGQSSLPKHKQILLSPDAYVEALVDAALRWQPADNEELVLEVDGARYLAPSLEAVARQLHSVGTSAERLREQLERDYRDVRVKPAAVALSWTHAGTDNIEGRDTNGDYYGELGFFENRFALSFGLRLHRILSAGVTLGVLHALVPDLLENESKALTSTTFGADVGLQLRPWAERPGLLRRESLVIGLAAYDLAAKNSWNTSGYWSLGTTRTDEFPRRYRAGLAWEALPGLQTFVDLESDLDQLVRAKAGAEATFSLGEDNELRFGVSERTTTAVMLRVGIDRDRPTFGLGLLLPTAGLGLTRLDYAFVVEPVSPAPTQVISWRFRF